uniref:Gastrin/cholecystokinin type B receptor n=1 Tax=Poecilia mexicana TaxID=48701 RepID=A0A3B3YZZ6_9TELE
CCEFIYRCCFCHTESEAGINSYKYGIFSLLTSILFRCDKLDHFILLNFNEICVSVSISTFSLVAIAIERYSAICNPLKSRAWQTRSHAYRVIAATWVVSLLVMVPYPVFNVLKSFPKGNGTVGNMCRLDWPSEQAEQTWYVLLLIILFFIPGVVMIIAYGLISRELYRGIQFELSQNKETAGEIRRATAGPSDDDDGCYIQVSKKPSFAVELPTLSSSTTTILNKAERARSNTSEAKLQAKRRVIRMLMVIVALFFICWMPLYSVNTWKAFDNKSAESALSGAPISFIHLLSYTSACVNPIIYCFMNTRFRKALLSTFACCCRNRLCRRIWWRRRREGEDGINATSMGTSMWGCCGGAGAKHGPLIEALVLVSVVTWWRLTNQRTALERGKPCCSGQPIRKTG